MNPKKAVVGFLASSIISTCIFAGEYGYMKVANGFNPQSLADLADSLAKYQAPDSYAPQNGSKSLLDYMIYDTVKRNQGRSGSCWMWATQAVMSIQYGIDRQILPENGFSVQFLASNAWMVQTSLNEGGNPQTGARFYETVGYNIPWTNTHADWTGQGGVNKTKSAWINTTPNMSVSSIVLKDIVTQGILQSEAIANLKSAIDTNRPIWFSYTLADEADWGVFLKYWDEGSDDEIIDLAKITEGHTLTNEGGSHAVTCVGYDDTDPEKPYWIILNSWGKGDSGNRTKGTFRMAMNTNYDAKINSGMEQVGIFQFYTFETTFGDTIQKDMNSLAISMNNGRANSDSFTIAKATFAAQEAPTGIKAATLYLNDEFYFQCNDKNGEWTQKKDGFMFKSKKGTAPNLQVSIDTKKNFWSAKLSKADIYRIVSVYDGLMFRLEYSTPEEPDLYIRLGRQHGFMIDEIKLKLNSGYKK